MWRCPKQDCNILGPILVSPYFEKLPCRPLFDFSLGMVRLRPGFSLQRILHPLTLTRMNCSLNLLRGGFAGFRV